MKNISPHLSIYKFPIAAISSITNRVTGLGLTGAFILYGCCKYQNYDKLINKKFIDLSDNSKRAILFPAMFSVNYHTLGGVRHYVLDKFPKYLNNKAMTRNSLFLFGSSLILSTITTELAKNEFKKK